MVAARHLTGRHSPGVTGAVMASCIEQEHFVTHQRRMCAGYQGVRDWLVGELGARLADHMAVQVPDQEMHVTAWLRQGLDGVGLAGRSSRGSDDAAAQPVPSGGPPVSALMLGCTRHEMAAMCQGLVGLLGQGTIRSG